MLRHVSVGVANVETALRFYDPVLGALGFGRVMEYLPFAVGYGEDAPAFWVQLPHDGQPATVGNGVHIAFAATTVEQIAAFHRAALAAGGSDEGVPGPRPDYGPDYYGAFVRDPDGNKLEAVLTLRPASAKPARKAPAAKRKATKPKAAKKRPRAKAKRSGASRSARRGAAARKRRR